MLEVRSLNTHKKIVRKPEQSHEVEIIHSGRPRSEEKNLKHSVKKMKCNTSYARFEGFKFSQAHDLIWRE